MHQYERSIVSELALHHHRDCRRIAWIAMMSAHEAPHNNNDNPAIRRRQRR
jgi:hypothetical protein